MFKILNITKKITIRKLILNVIIVLLVTFIYFSHNIIESGEETIEYNELACHYFKDEGALKALNELVHFKPNSIFFIESSCEGLTSRQACSIEAAARTNPNRHVIVLFTSPLAWDVYRTNGLSALMSMANTDAARIHIEDYIKGTPLHKLLDKSPLTHNDINMKIGDILKYLTLYKYSGTYLGLDVLVVRSFDALNGNWIVKDTPSTISTDMFSFSSNETGRSLAKMVLNILMGNLALPNRQDTWSFTNNNPMNELAYVWCLSTDILLLSSSMCKDLQVNDAAGFVPITVYERYKYFDQDFWVPSTNETIYTFLTFEHLTKYNVVPINSFYDKLAQHYCPIVYDFYGANFGLY